MWYQQWTFFSEGQKLTVLLNKTNNNSKMNFYFILLSLVTKKLPILPVFDYQRSQKFRLCILLETGICIKTESGKTGSIRKFRFLNLLNALKRIDNSHRAWSSWRGCRGGWRCCRRWRSCVCSCWRPCGQGSSSAPAVQCLAPWNCPTWLKHHNELEINTTRALIYLFNYFYGWTEFVLNL